MAVKRTRKKKAEEVIVETEALETGDVIDTEEAVERKALRNGYEPIDPNRAKTQEYKEGK